MKISRKIGIVIFIFLIWISCISNYSNAAGGSSGGTSISSGSITSSANGFINKGKGQAGGVGASGLLDGVKTAASILVSVGIFALAIATIILGIQYMTSPPQRQAALRAQMIGLLWGAVVILGAYGIWNIAVKIAETF